MRVVVWIAEGGWEAAVDAAALLGDADVTLLHVAGEVTDAPEGALAGLLGRRREAARSRLAELDAQAAARLLDAAEARLGRPAARAVRTGRPEREALAAARDADVLVLSRASGHPGPRSLGHAARFVVDHAPCRVLLTWPGEPPRDAPPPPPPRGGPPPPPPPHR